MPETRPCDRCKQATGYQVANEDHFLCIQCGRESGLIPTFLVLMNAEPPPITPGCDCPYCSSRRNLN